jgi:hypothetical protein
MGRLPDEEIERLKREVRLDVVVRTAGVELRKAGADLVGRCPFHDDREPSLVVSPAKNLWHCLGACQAGGSVIGLSDPAGYDSRRSGPQVPWSGPGQPPVRARSEGGQGSGEPEGSLSHNGLSLVGADQRSGGTVTGNANGKVVAVAGRP